MIYKFDTELALRQIEQANERSKNDSMIMYASSHKNDTSNSLKELACEIEHSTGERIE